MNAGQAVDKHFMHAAQQLALAALQRARPNPTVGCVIVNDGCVAGSGVSEPMGGAHAEVKALAAAENRARSATAYVTLEPCAHQGQTPPCTDALIHAGVARVCIGLADPNPLVNGQGVAALTAAGIEVTCDTLSENLQSGYRGFFSRIERGRPWVTLKVAASLDGGTAMASGESQWITGPAARACVHEMRATAGAVLVGSGTVIADNPQLTARLERSVAIQPRAVVVDTELRSDPQANVMQRESTLVFAKECDGLPSEHGKARVVAMPPVATGAGLALRIILQRLAELGVNDVFVEAGARLAGSLLADGLVDEFRIILAPRLLGGNSKRMFATHDWSMLADGQALVITDVQQTIDGDLVLRALPDGEME